MAPDGTLFSGNHLCAFVMAKIEDPPRGFPIQDIVALMRRRVGGPQQNLTKT